MKSPGDVGVGESAPMGVGWLNPGRRSEALEQRRTTLPRSVLDEVKRAALRYCGFHGDFVR
jgi:hypothetical protein